MAGVQRRGKARAAEPSNRYDAGGAGRRIARWSPPASGPQRALQGFERLRSRVHDAVRNDWAAESSTQKWVTNLIGTGIQPRFKSKPHRALWDQFVKQADADGVLDAYGLQVLLGRGLFDGGEVFLRRRPRALTSPLDIPVQVQVIESEFCPMLDANTYAGMPEGNTIRQGIERNAYGQRTAYWFYREHPGDGFQQPAGNQLIRVAASQVAHVYEVKRAGQLRGVSPLANILVRLRSTGDFEDASLDRNKLANLFALFITRPMPDPEEIDTDALTGLPTFYGKPGEGPSAGLEPGISHELRPGEDVKFASPPGPGVGHGEYLRANNLGTAAGQGLPYELMTGDIANVSDRTLRVVINEFRRYCQQRQWITLIPQGCQRMLDWCMDAAALAGLLPLDQLPAAKAPTWTPQGWEYIHPTQDAQGKKILLDMGVVSRTGIITERGDEPDKVLDERKADKAAEDKAGLTPVAPPGVAPKMELDPQPVALATPAGPSSADQTLAALVTLMAGMQAHNATMAGAISALAAQLADRPINVAAPNVKVGGTVVNVPPAEVHVAAPNVQVDVAAPTVNVQPAAVQVDVAAPTINVTNDVQPAAVQVDVNLPERQTTSEIKRDATGNIVGVTQTERTLQ